jgi:hypothetical protein
LSVHVALLVARHGLRAVFRQFLHLDVVRALGALVLRWDGGENGEEDVEAEPGAVVGVRCCVWGRDVSGFDLTPWRMLHRSWRVLACKSLRLRVLRICSLCSCTKAGRDWAYPGRSCLVLTGCVARRRREPP